MRQIASILVLAFVLSLGLVTGCEKDRTLMTDAELGLNAQQASGRRVFKIYCGVCHPAYSTHGNKGPGLKGLYKKEYLPSGLTTTDEHVEQSIIRGRNMMPSLANSLDREQIDDVMAYLRTL